jgi:hypothetical protein
MPHVIEAPEADQENLLQEFPAKDVESLPPMPLEPQRKRSRVVEMLKAFVAAYRLSMRQRKQGINRPYPHRQEFPTDSVAQRIMYLPF